jgi:hypothetical protein
MSTQKIREANILAITTRKIIIDNAWDVHYRVHWLQVTLDPQNQHLDPSGLQYIFQKCNVSARKIAELINL